MKFKKLIKFVTQSYLSLLNSFLFLSRFSVSLKNLNNYFFRRFAYKSLLNRFSVLIDYIMWSFNHFSTSSCFLHFLGSRFLRVLFKVPVQGLGPGFWSSPFKTCARYFLSIFYVSPNDSPSKTMKKVFHFI